MARTLSEILRKRKSSSSANEVEGRPAAASSTAADPNNTNSYPRTTPILDFVKAGKSQLERWMQQPFKKFKKGSPQKNPATSVVVVCESSSDDDDDDADVEQSSMASTAAAASVVVHQTTTPKSSIYTARNRSTVSTTSNTPSGTTTKHTNPSTRIQDTTHPSNNHNNSNNTNKEQENHIHRRSKRAVVTEHKKCDMFVSAPGQQPCQAGDCEFAAAKGTFFCTIHEHYDQQYEEEISKPYHRRHHHNMEADMDDDSTGSSDSNSSKSDGSSSYSHSVQQQGSVADDDDNDKDDDDNSVEIIATRHVAPPPRVARPIVPLPKVPPVIVAPISATTTQGPSIKAGQGPSSGPGTCIALTKLGKTCYSRTEPGKPFCQKHLLDQDRKFGTCENPAGRVTCIALTRLGKACHYATEPGKPFCQKHLLDQDRKFGTCWNPYGGEFVGDIDLSHVVIPPRDSRLPEHIGTNQCIGVTTRYTQCKGINVPGSPFCRIHTRTLPLLKIKGLGQQIYEGYPSVATIPGPCKMTEKKAEKPVMEKRNSPTSSSTSTPSSTSTRSTNNGQLYTRRKDTERCIYVSLKGKACPFEAVNTTVYCDKHASLNEELKLGGYEIGTSSKSCDESTSSASGSGDSDEDDECLGQEIYSSSEGEDDDDDAEVVKPYTHKEFLRMWQDCESFCGERTDEIENTRRVRGANQKMSPEDTDGQLKAQYGRLLPYAMKILVKDILKLNKDDVFLDIGHGIGNTCIQAAFTIGCEARGIEVVKDRHHVAEVFRDVLVAQNEQRPRPRLTGNILLRYGRLEDVVHREFLSKGVTSAYVNNFNGVFAERSSKVNQKWFLDDFVAGLFALMAPGARMVTLHPLNLGPTQEEANNTREKQGLSRNKNASFYQVERVLLGKACSAVKWNQHSGNQKKIYVYKYTRLPQPAGEDAVFLCCNPQCENAKGNIPIPATTLNEEGRTVINHCECRFTAKNLRRQRRKIYTDS